MRSALLPEAPRPEAPTFSQRRLVERLRAGEDDAFEALVRSLWAPAVRFVRRATRTADAEDVVQEAFISLYEHRHELDAARSVRAYLYRTIRNRLIDRSRRLRVRDRDAIVLGAAAPLASPLRELEGLELREAVERAIDALPERARDAFVLAYLDDLSYREIGDVMGISPKTVGHHVSTALSHLRSALAYLLHEV